MPVSLSCAQLKLLASALPMVLASGAATQAAVVISAASTQNMSCTDGACTPTAADAVLNAGDLETMLASGNVTVTTIGSGIQASDIDAKAAVAWSTGTALTLEAAR